MSFEESLLLSLDSLVSVYEHNGFGKRQAPESQLIHLGVDFAAHDYLRVCNNYDFVE